MLQINPELIIPQDELEYRFLHGSGPGGQNINKVATVVQLRFNVRNSRTLQEDIKDRLILLAGSRMNNKGILIIEAKRFRTQEKNKADAEARLISLVQRAIIKPQARRQTKPNLSSQKKRLEDKKHRGLIKRIRGSSDNFDI